MTKREQLIEQYEDALFALLMDSVAEEEGKKAIELNERLKADPEAEVPAEVRRRCEKLIRQEFNRKKARNLGRMTWKMVQRISVAVMLLLVLLTTAMAASEQLRLSILNVVIRTCEQYTEFTFEKEGNKDIEQVPQSASTNQDANMTYYYDLGFEWIPEGYEVGDNGWADGKKNRLVCIYDQEGHRIDVNVVQYSEKTIHKFVSEESRKSNVEIQGYSATLYEKDLDSVYSQTLVWLDEENHYIIQITSTGEAKNALTSDQLVMLAEGLRW